MSEVSPFEFLTGDCVGDVLSLKSESVSIDLTLTGTDVFIDGLGRTITGTLSGSTTISLTRSHRRKFIFNVGDGIAADEWIAYGPCCSKDATVWFSPPLDPPRVLVAIATIECSCAPAEGGEPCTDFPKTQTRDFSFSLFALLNSAGTGSLFFSGQIVDADAGCAFNIPNLNGFAGGSIPIDSADIPTVYEGEIVNIFHRGDGMDSTSTLAITVTFT